MAVAEAEVVLSEVLKPPTFGPAQARPADLRLQPALSREIWDTGDLPLGSFPGLRPR